MVDKKKLKRGKKNPIDDRIVFFMKMTPRVIKEIKQAALEEDRAAWAVMEEAAEQWLARRGLGEAPEWPCSFLAGGTR